MSLSLQADPAHKPGPHKKVLSSGATGRWCAQTHDHLLYIPSLQTVWHVGVPPPAFSETVWVLNCLIPHLLGACLCLSCEKLLCSEEDHRLRLSMLTFTKCVRDAGVAFPAVRAEVQSSLSRCSALKWAIKAGKVLPVPILHEEVSVPPLHGGLTHSLSQMAVGLSVTMIKLSLIPAGEA